MGLSEQPILYWAEPPNASLAVHKGQHQVVIDTRHHYKKINYRSAVQKGGRSTNRELLRTASSKGVSSQCKGLIMVPRSRNARGLRTPYVLAGPPCVHHKGLTCASQKL